MAAAVLAAGLAPVAAHAQAVEPILYVNRSGNCSDTGTGEQWRPFCTIQKAADVVQPGQTVHISSEIYSEGLTFGRSGTPEAPIRFEATSVVNILPPVGYKVTFAQGLHDVQFAGLRFADESKAPASLSLAGTNSLLFERGAFDFSVLDISNASRITIQRSRLYNAVTVGTGASDVVLSTNLMTGSWRPGQPAAVPTLTVSGAVRTVITSNTMKREHSGVLVSGGAADTRFTNNYFLPRYAGGASVHPVVEVAAGATASTKINYSAFGLADGTKLLYRWGGTDYLTLAGFHSATGQGTADVSENMTIAEREGMSFTPIELVDSADAGAPGQLAVDFDGRRRIRNPGKSNPGPSVHDRGAYESYPEIRVNGPELSAADTPDGLTAVWKDITYSSSWGGIKAQATYTWSDGAVETELIDLPPVTGRWVKGVLKPVTHRFGYPGMNVVELTLTLPGQPVTPVKQSQLVYVPALTSVPVRFTPDTSQVEADFDGDGHDDLLTWESQTRGEGWFLHKGSDGTITPALEPAWLAYCWNASAMHLTAGDFDGNGTPELGILFQRTNGYAGFYTFAFNKATGKFDEPKLRWEAPYWGTGTKYVSTGDFNGDGRADLALFYSYGGSHVSVFTLNGNADGSLGGFKQQWNAPQWGGGTQSMTAGDFNGDGKSDLALFYSYGGSHVAVFTLDGGKIAQRWNAPHWGGGTKFVQAGNFAGDGKTDLTLFYDYGKGHVTVFSLAAGDGGTFTELSTIWDGAVWGAGTRAIRAGNYTTKTGRADIVLLYKYDDSTSALFRISPAQTGKYSGPKALWNSVNWQQPWAIL